MQSLTNDQIEQVSGGAFPVLIAVASAAYSFAGHFAVRSLGGYVMSRAATLAAVYSGLEVAGSYSGKTKDRSVDNAGERDLKKAD